MIPRSRLRAACALALLILLCLPAVALGHAELVSSDPPDGGTISERPYQLVAEFDDELAADRSRIVVRDAAGNEVARGGVSDDDARVMLVDLSDVAPGSYTARWTAVTPDDSGITRGNIDFTLAPAAASPPPPTDRSGEPTMSASSSVRPTQGLTPTPPPTPDPGPTGGDGAPTASTTDLLIALLLAGAVVSALVYFLWRRRAG